MNITSNKLAYDDICIIHRHEKTNQKTIVRINYQALGNCQLLCIRGMSWLLHRDTKTINETIKYLHTNHLLTKKRVLIDIYQKSKQHLPKLEKYLKVVYEFDYINSETNTEMCLVILEQ